MSWIFILRANKTAGAERHPNGIQRRMSYFRAQDPMTGEEPRRNERKVAAAVRQATAKQ